MLKIRAVVANGFVAISFQAGCKVTRRDGETRAKRVAPSEFVGGEECEVLAQFGGANDVLGGAGRLGNLDRRSGNQRAENEQSCGYESAKTRVHGRVLRD